MLTPYADLSKERIQHLDADHRRVCKFDSPTNPNYLILKRAFLTTIKALGAGGKFIR